MTTSKDKARDMIFHSIEGCVEAGYLLPDDALEMKQQVEFALDLCQEVEIKKEINKRISLGGFFDSIAEAGIANLKA